MKWLPALLCTVALSACSGPRLLNTIATNPDRGTDIVRNLPYGSLDRQMLDLYVPDAEGPHPVLIFFHGGSWASGSKGEYAFAGKRFASLGYLTAVVNYRLSTNGRYPLFMEDAAAATDYVLTHAAEYDGDPDRLFVTGHSAGGYIAVQLGVAENFLAAEGRSVRDIDGVAGIAGPYDFLPSDLQVVHDAFGKGSDAEITMPVNRVTSNAPPMLLLTGGEDEDVLEHNAPNMAAALKAKNIPVQIITYPEANHEQTLIAIAFGGREFPVAQDIVAFFDELPSERLESAIGQ